MQRRVTPGHLPTGQSLKVILTGLIEGIAIASYAIGASNAIIFMRSGSDHAKNRLQKAIERARDYGLFGHNIFSSGYNLDITIRLNRELLYVEKKQL